MRNTTLSKLTYAIPLTALALGALLLIPGEEPAPQAHSVNEVPTRTVPSYLAVSPKLVAELDASLKPSVVDVPVIEHEAGRPDPSATDTGRAPTITQVAMVQPATTTEPEVTAAPESVDPAKALQVGSVAVNMRSGPSTSNGVIRTLQPGEPLIYGETSGGWVSVTTEAGETGWVYNRYVTGPALPESTSPRKPERQASVDREPAPKKKQVSNGRYARVGSDVYLRAGPSQSTERVFMLPAGERVQVAERRGNWARVVLPSGASGWVRVK